MVKKFKISQYFITTVNYLQCIQGASARSLRVKHEELILLPDNFFVIKRKQKKSVAGIDELSHLNSRWLQFDGYVLMHSVYLLNEFNF